jgi:hypothetical protein
MCIEGLPPLFFVHHCCMLPTTPRPPLRNQILRAWKHEQLCLGDVKLENFVVRDTRRQPEAEDASPSALDVYVIDLAGANEVRALLHCALCYAVVVVGVGWRCLCVCHLQFPTAGTAVEARFFTEGYQAPGAEGMLTRTSDYYALGVSIKRMLDLHYLRASGSDSASTTQLHVQLQCLTTALLSNDEVQQEAGVESFLTSRDSNPGRRISFPPGSIPSSDLVKQNDAVLNAALTPGLGQAR